MKKQTEYAIRLAHHAAQNPNLIWRLIAERIGEAGAQQARQYVRSHETITPTEHSGDLSWALQQFATFDCQCRWAESGFPLVVIAELEDAIELANTDPPVWLLTSPHGDDEFAVLGVEFGDYFTLIINWRTGAGIWIEEDRSQPVPFEEDEGKRLIANVGYALQTRPEGLDIREHRPSPKAMRKQGRKFYPTVQYIIQAPRDLHPPEPSTERGARAEGWTMSVRSHVRGHWRQQAHGPGYSLHKTIWIRPTWRGPVDAPISIHPTRLGPGIVSTLAPEGASMKTKASQ